MFISTVDPVAFSVGPLSVRWYGLLFSGGFIIGYLIMQLMFRNKHYRTEDLDKLLWMLFVATLVGARLAHCLVYEPDYFLAHPLEILKIWKGGLASHGGTVGVLLATWWFCHRHHYHFLEIVDMLNIPTALVCTLIRLGNFMNSEIVGIPTFSDYGVVFTALGENFPRHPAQLYEAACYFAIFVVLTLVYTCVHRRAAGTIFGAFITWVFVSRFFIEFIKVEQADYNTGSILTVGQYLSLPFIFAGILIMIGARVIHVKNSLKERK